MTLKLLTEHHLEFLSLTGGCTGSSESTFAKMPHCWKSHVAAKLYVSQIVASQITDEFMKRYKFDFKPLKEPRADFSFQSSHVTIQGTCAK